MSPSRVRSMKAGTLAVLINEIPIPQIEPNNSQKLNKYLLNYCRNGERNTGFSVKQTRVKS